jgi:radical SAM superfamily enzyme YgiQ (UPF0313 family)
MKYAICAADTFSLGAGYLISYLRNEGHEVKLIFDPMHHSQGGTKETFLSRIFSVEEYNLKQLEEFKPDAVLFSVLTAHYQWALKLAKKIKDRIGCKIIFGGVHATSVPEEVKKHDFIDEVCIGEGIKHFGGDFNPDKLFPERRDFYAELPSCHRVHPFIMTDFGCPFSCTYCLPRELKIKRPRRSVRSCIDELKMLKAMGAKRVSIWDDAFTCNRTWLNEFLTYYMLEVKLPFRCLTHPKLIDPIMARNLKQAGCYTIDMGIQTGNEKLRREVLNRKETNKEFLAACKAIKDAGIKLVIDHIFEIPGESDDTNKDSYILYSQAKPDLIHCFKLLYFPRSKIIEKALEAGYLREEDIQKINEGKGAVYASGEHQRVAKINPWVKRMLAIPLPCSRAWELMPDWLIKLACYIRIGEDFLPQTIIQNQAFFTYKRIEKWLKSTQK